MPIEQPLLLARLNDGREIPTKPCNCGHCGNEWFMVALSEEWMPNFCPYCGIRFIRRESDGVPGDFSPAS